MNNLSNEPVTNERLEEYLDKRMCNVTEEFRIIVRELLAYREAQGKVVAYIDNDELERLADDDSGVVRTPNFGSGYQSATIPLYSAPPLPAVPQALLRELVDVVWQDAKESTEVPATSHADKLILQVFGNSEQVNSPVIPDGWALVPRKLTAENGAKGALLGEFLETKYISCPECFGDDDCESCDGSGRIKVDVTVSWDTIKRIYSSAIDLFCKEGDMLAAAPKPGGVNG